MHHEDTGGIYYHYVAEGAEVPPSGRLLEYSDSAPGVDGRPYHQTAHQPLLRRQRYPLFFVSYRREDSEPYAWRLHESLGGSWGTEDVFLDQFSIKPGEVFPWTIQQAAVHARAMVVLIGPGWVRATDRRGSRRLDNEHDFVRREIVAALDRGTLITPLLVGSATIPDASELPEEMRGLLDLQFFELSARHWGTDVGLLKDHLEGYFRNVLKVHIG